MATRTERQGERISDAAEDVKQRAAAGAEDLRDRAEERADAWSRGLGEHAGNIAEAVRQAGESARGKEDWLADAANGLSRNLNGFAETARDKGLGGMRRDVEMFARDRPLLFMGAAVMAGLALGRVLRSTPPTEQQPHYGGAGTEAGISPDYHRPGLAEAPASAPTTTMSTGTEGGTRGTH